MQNEMKKNRRIIKQRGYPLTDPGGGGGGGGGLGVEERALTSEDKLSHSGTFLAIFCL